MPESPDAISARSITKRFALTCALASVDIAFRPAEVHGIVGENGAGKSTLMKILGGIEPPTSGRIFVRGVPCAFRGVLDAQRLGIVMIHQELNLVDELSVADNIFLGRELTRLGLVQLRKSREITRGLLHRLDAAIDPAARVKNLSVAHKQMVEIAKALSTDASVLIMDEPTAVLTRRETTALFQIIAQLRRSGVAVLYISHILPEVLHICDRVTVMRDGRMVASIPPDQMAQTTEQQLASLMVGRPMAQHFPPRSGQITQPLLEVESLSVPGHVENAAFSLRRGEILGFAGLIGAGRTALAEALAGLREKSSGVIRVAGVPVSIRFPRDALRAGIAYLSEDRKETGLMLDLDVVQNTTLVSLPRYTRLFIRRRAEEAAANRRVQQLRIKIAGLRQPVRWLSGGNQQKVALAKWLETNPKILIVDEPTRGVDVGAKEEIYRLLRSLIAAGMACILISSELNEVLGMSDRIAVMRNGRIVATLNAQAATEELLMRHAAGVAEVVLQ